MEKELDRKRGHVLGTMLMYLLLGSGSGIQLFRSSIYCHVSSSCIAREGEKQNHGEKQKFKS
jgi:hypothetical protein